MKRETARWVRKAEADIRGARHLAGGRTALNDLICFHCQQAAEKYLKALVQELGIKLPHIHDLEDLLALLVPHDATLQGVRRACSTLTPYAVDYRYPGENATKRDAQAAIRKAERIRVEIRKRLKLAL